MKILAEEDFQSKYSSSHKNSNDFDLYLSEYQEDIKRIIGKFRKNYHALSPEDLASECNMHLLKYKNKILNSFSDSEFTQNEFKKISYHYVKNLVSWSHYSEVNEKYNAKRLDSVHETEDGPKTTFEFAIESKGEEDSFFEIFDSTNGINNFYHILMNYSYLLSETECKILSFLKKGMSQDEIADILGVTHQAVSHGFVTLKEKMQAYFDFNEIFEHSIDKVSDGEKAIDDLLTPRKKQLSEKDIEKIKKFVLRFPKQYCPQEISEKLFKGKFDHFQISGCLRKLKLRFLAVKAKPVLQCKFKNEILELYKNGKDTKYISDKLNIPFRTVACIRGHLTKNNLLESVR